MASFLPYYYILSSQNNLLQNEVLEEVLRERTAYYQTQKKKRNFWVNISPNFVQENTVFFKKLIQTNFYQQHQKQLKKIELKEKKTDKLFLCSIVSYDKKFIDWLALRLGYSESIQSAFETNQISNGIIGSSSDFENKENLLKGSSSSVSPSILLLKIQKIIQLLSI